MVDSIFNCGHIDRGSLYFLEEYQQILTTHKWDAPNVLSNSELKLKSELIEKFLRSWGVVGIAELKDRLVPFLPAFGGDIDIDGLGLDVTGNTLNGDYIEGRRGENVAIIFNNSMYMPDTPYLHWYAQMFEETDKSIRNNLLMSRLMPLGLAADEQSKKAIEAAYKKVLDGDLYAIAKINKIIDEEGFKTADITNIDNITKIQYLSKFYDDLTRRLYVKYGVPMTNSNSKMAQTNEAELAGYEFFSQIYLNDTLEQRKIGAEEVNRIFGDRYGEWSVDLSAPFSQARKEALSTEGGEDEAEDAEVEETEEVTENNEEVVEEKEEKENE